MRLLSSLLSTLSILSLLPPIHSEPLVHAPQHEPKAPGLTFLYTCLVECHNGLYTTEGPRGLRTTIPILGGNVTGPRISGRIRDVGADWGVTDVQTGVCGSICNKKVGVCDVC